MTHHKRVDDRNPMTRPRPPRRNRAVFRGPKAVDTSQQSFFEFMTEKQLEQAKVYFYDHPEELPYRPSGAHQKAKLKALPIRVQFDERIFERKVQLRPIPECESEGVDPFTLDPPTEESNAVAETAPSTTRYPEEKRSTISHQTT